MYGIWRIFHKLQFQHFRNYLNFERLSQMLDFNFDFITHTKKSDFEKKKLRCPFKNFHSFRKFLNVFDYFPPDAGH